MLQYDIPSYHHIELRKLSIQCIAIDLLRNTKTMQFRIANNDDHDNLHETATSFAIATETKDEHRIWRERVLMNGCVHTLCVDRRAIHNGGNSE